MPNDEATDPDPIEAHEPVRESADIRTCFALYYYALMTDAAPVGQVVCDRLEGDTIYANGPLITMVLSGCKH
jgi:hypothetical protein